MEQKYKIGDRVRIRSFDWYNENKDEYGDIDCGNVVFLKSMQRFCGRIVTIIDVDEVQNIYTTVLKKDYLSIENHAAEVMQLNGEMIEGLVEEETKPKFKVGDKVRIKSEDWYKQMLSIPNKLVWQNKLTNDFVGIWCGSHIFKESMFEFLGKTMTIQEVGIDFYLMEEDTCGYEFNDEMIEGLVKEETKPKFKVGDRVITNKGYIGKFEGWVSDYQVRVLFEESGCNVVIHPKDLKLAEEETKPNITEEAKTYWDNIKDAWICPEGYIFKDENGNEILTSKIILEKKKKEYPKTYAECCKVLDWNHRDYDRVGYKSELLCKLQVLLLCRDAYWKIAGEEMGLDGPWESDWNSGYFTPAIIYRSGFIQKVEVRHRNAILVFPTKEMRDAFYENFKKEIEICKELL